MKNPRSAILPFLFAAILDLLMGLWAGLARLGWAIPVAPTALPGQHGPLMISGFLGTLIALERVAALRRRWMFAAPLFSGVGWIFGLALPASWLGPLLITLGSVFATGILLVIVRQEPQIYTLAMVTGVLCWFVGNLLWIAGAPIFQLVWIWGAFLVLTIAGERVELSRILRFKRWHYGLFALTALTILIGAFLNTRFPQIGTRLAGAGMLDLAIWLLRFDIARRNLRHRLDITRYIAICLYIGFIWLGISGLLNLFFGPQFAGLRYDATLHSVFIGFVFSMIFGHALIILPALVQVNVSFSKIFYLPLIFLHGSLFLRITSDLAGWQVVRMWGGMLNEVAILLFMGVFVSAVFKQAKRPLPLKTQPVSEIGETE
jgi:hypothetical protein